MEGMQPTIHNSGYARRLRKVRQTRCPFLELLDPVGDGRQRDNNEEGPAHVKSVAEVCQEAEALDGFAKAHFVSEDAIVALAPGMCEPVDACGPGRSVRQSGNDERGTDRSAGSLSIGPPVYNQVVQPLL